MLRSHLTLALRHLRRHPGYAVLNILGLAVSLTCCILLVLYIQHEMSFDRFHQKAHQIYRISGDRFAPTPAPWAPALVNDFPEVLQAIRIKTPFSRWHLLAGDQGFWEKGLYFADAGFFEMFDFPLAQGDPNTVLIAPNTVVISETAARRYFGADDPVGKRITLESAVELTITGIMKDMPSNSHIRCDFLASFATLETDQRWYGDLTDFATQGFNLHVYTYLLMQEDYPADTFADKIPGFLEAHLGDKANAGMLSQRFSLQPITDVYLHSGLDAEMGVTSDIVYVYIFGTLAFFVMLLACINFMNLATARAAMRTREVGLRKVIGAQRGQLIRQFMSEALLIAALALLIALILADLAAPLFSELAGRQISVDYADARLWLTALAITLFTGLLAGSYPALFLSALRPITMVGGKLPSTFATTLARKGLVVLQFGISIVMIISTGVATNQMNYLRDKTLGFDRDHLIVVPLGNNDVRQRYPVWKQALLQRPGVERVTGASSVPGEQTFGRYLVQPAGAGDDRGAVTALYATDYDYVPALGIELTAGRNFSRDATADTREAAIINESAVAAMGLETLVGAQIELLHTPITRTVIGVIRDFHTQSLHHAIEPIMLMVSPETEAGSFLYAMIRIRNENIPQTLEYIGQIWTDIYPDYPFEYSFLDQDLDRLYRTEQRMGQIFGVAAFMAVLIACLGIFGLASFMVARRTRELGIRKVVGASKAEILRLLSMEYVRLILVANGIAYPVAYIIMRRWLEDFAYRTGFDPWTFILTGVLTIGITLLTIAYHAVRAARTNPVDALRYE